MPDPGRWSYLLVLGFVLMGCLWLEVALRTRVLRRWRRFLGALVIPVVVFMAWDAYAIARGHWYFNPARILGWEVLAGVPLDELLFFLTIPLAAILTLEAVRSVKAATPGWQVGDEPREPDATGELP
jgi:lycopene cyclase domain-containing protein